MLDYNCPTIIRTTWGSELPRSGLPMVQVMSNEKENACQLISRYMVQGFLVKFCAYLKIFDITAGKICCVLRYIPCYFY
jgi:hypothetical protein